MAPIAIDRETLEKLVRCWQEHHGLTVDGTLGPKTEASLWPQEITGTVHFDLAEFACKDGTAVPESMRADALLLMHELEVLRSRLHGASIRIVSGYRSPSYNKRIGGSKASKHMLAQAADIRVSGHQPKEVADAIEELIKTGEMQDGGLGRYPGFTHYDVRGKRARWGKN